MSSRRILARLRSAVARRLGTLIRAALLVTLLAAAAGRAGVLWTHVEEHPRLPQWDMARHGLDALGLAVALAEGDLAGFAGRLYEMSVWPPLVPLLTAPVMLIWGADWAVPRHLTTVLFVLTALALVLAGRALDRRVGTAAGIVAAALWLASPFVHLMSVLVMLEVPGALFTVLALAAYAHALEGEEDPRRFRLAAILATLLFFCKYNYGLLFLVPLVLNEAWRRWGSPRAALLALGARLRRVDPRRPALLAAAAWVGLTALVLSSGGFEGTVFGHQVRLTSWGGPLHLLFFAGVAAQLSRSRRRRWRAWLAAQSVSARAFFTWTALPIIVWLLLPPHFGELLAFVDNRSTGPPPWSAAFFTYYPLNFTGWYTPPRPWGSVVLLLALVPVLLLPRLDPRRRMLALALVVGVLAVLVHPYKLPRFLFTLAPLAWLAAGWTITRAFLLLPSPSGRGAGGEGSPTARRESLPPLLAAGVLAAVLLSGGVDRAELARGFELRTVPRASEPVLRLIARVARNQPETAVLGTWNDLSPALVEWFLRRDPSFPRDRLPRFSRLGSAAPGEICRVLEARRVVVLEPLEPRPVASGRADFSAETAWLEPWREALARESCYTPTRDWILEEAGYRLRVYARAPGRAQTSTRTWPRHAETCIIASSCAAVAQADRAGVS